MRRRECALPGLIHPKIENAIIPNIYRAGTGPVWDWALSTFDAFDPHRIFSNPFLDAIFQ
jgi:hypothetical protein